MGSLFRWALDAPLRRSTTGFWAGLFLCTTDPRSDRGCPNAGRLRYVELFSFPDYRERGSYPESKGLRHLAFAVNDVEASAAFLKSKNVNVHDVRIDELTGKKFVFFMDPNGQPLELYEE